MNAGAILALDGLVVAFEELPDVVRLIREAAMQGDSEAVAEELAYLATGMKRLAARLLDLAERTAENGIQRSDS